MLLPVRMLSTMGNGSLIYGYHNRSMYYTDYDVPSLAMSTNVQILVIVLYTISTLLSVIGNLVVIGVLSTRSRGRADLNTFLLNLAIADFLMAIFCMPFSFTQTMLGEWVFGRLMCPVVMFIQIWSVTVSIYINVSIGIDRYWAVMFPLKSRLGKRKAKVVVGLVWLLSLSVSSVPLFVSRTRKEYYGSIDFYGCNEEWPYDGQRQQYTISILFITFIIPLSILMFAYYKVGKVLWDRSVPGNADAARDLQQLSSKRKVIRMLIAIVTVFAVCWLPLHTFNIVFDCFPSVGRIETAEQENTLLGVFFACHWLAMSHSCINPIIYCFMNDRFRESLESICLRCRTHIFDTSHGHIENSLSTYSRQTMHTFSRQRNGHASSRNSFDNRGNQQNHTMLNQTVSSEGASNSANAQNLEQNLIPMVDLPTENRS